MLLNWSVRLDVFWPICPAYRRNPDWDASCPVFSVIPYWVHVMQPGMEICVVFCTFAGINFLTENESESRNLHLKFQKNFRGRQPRTGPTLREMGTPSRIHLQHGLFRKGESAPGAGTQIVMLRSFAFLANVNSHSHHVCYTLSPVRLSSVVCL